VCSSDLNGGKKIFVFGHMDKYGDVSAEMHKKLGFELAKLNIDTILCYAGDAKSTYDGLKEIIHFFGYL